MCFQLFGKQNLPTFFGAVNNVKLHENTTKLSLWGGARRTVGHPQTIMLLKCNLKKTTSQHHLTLFCVPQGWSAEHNAEQCVH